MDKRFAVIVKNGFVLGHFSVLLLAEFIALVLTALLRCFKSESKCHPSSYTSCCSIYSKL